MDLASLEQQSRDWVALFHRPLQCHATWPGKTSTAHRLIPRSQAIAESIANAPIPAETLRALAASELTTTRNLLAYLDLDGLQYVRDRLHSPDFLRVCDQGPLAETRAVVLDTACRALAVFGWASERYFLECGDMLPSAPDTIDELDNQPGDG